MTIKKWKKEILTIPNMLSLFRLVLLPVFLWIYLHASAPSHYLIAAGILAASCFTDMIDGIIARRFQMISTVGKILDPFADKVTQFTLIICLTIRYPILWLIVGLFIVKECFQLVAGLVTLSHGKMLTGALYSGKICTVVLFVSLILLIALPELQHQFIGILSAIDGVFLAIAFGNYMHAYRKHSSVIQPIDTDIS